MLKIFAVLFIFSVVGNVFAQNEPDNSTRAKAFFNALLKKDFAAAYELFADEVKPQLPVEALPQIRAQLTDEDGEFVGVKEAKKASDGRKVIVTVEFAKKSENLVVNFNAQGKIVGFFIAPPEKLAENAPKYETPKYADTNSFTETEITVGTGEWALPGTLTMPKGKTNVPAIVLVHGSGPNDRDETHINRSNKIFKDLAWGLASEGIAVLRYDKRTLVHGREMVNLTAGFTVNDETVDDALKAVELLRKTMGVDPKKIYVLGHSLGGMMIPRIGQRDAKIAGLVVFAGTARPLEDVVVEQYNYLGSLDGAPSKEAQTQIDETKLLAEATKKLKSTDAPDTKTLFSLPVAYWVDLNNYNPSAAAQKLKQPMLLLQGESDYQVTTQDFAVWKNALGKRKNVIFKTYPKLTHTFMEGLGGKPNPKDYDKTSHVSETVINDIADWITKTAR